VVARVVQQEGVVAVRRVDLGVAHVDAVVDQRLDDLALRAGEKRQSVVKLTTGSADALAAAKAAARLPPCSRAGSK
jgi:hypothetical protein